MDIKKIYRTVVDEQFPSRMEISFGEGSDRQTLIYEKVTWKIDDKNMGLRYGENPGQQAAMYKLINGNLTIGEVTNVTPGEHLASLPELLQSGKHPGKINITDIDAALNILRYLMDEPTCVIIKHNNPCGVAKGETIEQAYARALMADRLAAFGGCAAFNRAVDKQTAEGISEHYVEVVAAPEFEEGVLPILAERKNLRIFRIGNIEKLSLWAGQPFIDFKSLIDGGLIAQWSFVPVTLDRADFQPAAATYKGKDFRVKRQPSDQEWDDLLFGWKVEAGVTSNSVLYVKNGVTVGIGTGEQDRVGVAEIARDKAYRKLADKLAWERFKVPFNSIEDPDMRESIWNDAVELKGGMIGSCMISDAFFPFRDGVDIGIREGITAVIQPGGSMNDHEVITACNENNVAMVFTGQRSFKH